MGKIWISQNLKKLSTISDQISYIKKLWKSQLANNRLVRKKIEYYGAFGTTFTQY